MKYVVIPERKAIPLHCQRCNHFWNYCGLNTFVVSCPHCKTSVSVKKANKEESDMNSEVKESLRIIKVINEHLAEQPECKHDLKTIMREAMEN